MKIINIILDLMSCKTEWLFYLCVLITTTNTTPQEEIDKYFVADMDEKYLLKFSSLLHMFTNMLGKKIQIGKDLIMPPYLCSHLT